MSRDPRDVVLKIGAGCLVCLLLLILGNTVGSSAPAPLVPVSYVGLADQLNEPELANIVQFDNDGRSLLCFVDSAWRSATPTQQREFALFIARKWAVLTGDPSSPAFFGTGHGTFFAVAAARSRVDGQPFFRACQIDASDMRY